MLVDRVQESVMNEEYAKVCACECCEERKSALIYLVKQSFCTVLSHVCPGCRIELEAGCILQDLEYQFLSK